MRGRHHTVGLLAIAVIGGVLYTRATEQRELAREREPVVRQVAPFARTQPRFVDDGEPAKPPETARLSTPERFEEALRSPAVDGAWTLDVEKRVREAFATHSLALRDMRCGGEICKLTVDNREETRDELRLALLTLPATRQQAIPDDNGMMAVYLEQ